MSLTQTVEPSNSDSSWVSYHKRKLIGILPAPGVGWTCSQAREQGLTLSAFRCLDSRDLIKEVGEDGEGNAVWETSPRLATAMDRHADGYTIFADKGVYSPDS